MKDALYKIESMSRFAGLELGDDRLPDESTLLQFRHLLEQHALSEHLFAAVNERLHALGLQVSQGTGVDATLIKAPPSTKNSRGRRDPDKHSTHTDKQWYFGMKIHTGAGVNSGAAHTVTVTAANAARPHRINEAAARS